jgi:hypothetical protein
MLWTEGIKGIAGSGMPSKAGSSRDTLKKGLRKVREARGASGKVEDEIQEIVWMGRLSKGSKSRLKSTNVEEKMPERRET